MTDFSSWDDFRSGAFPAAIMLSVRAFQITGFIQAANGVSL